MSDFYGDITAFPDDKPSSRREPVVSDIGNTVKVGAQRRPTLESENSLIRSRFTNIRGGYDKSADLRTLPYR